MDIKEIIGKLNLGQVFPEIRRRKYKYDMGVAMRTVEEIGRMRREDFVIDGENRFVYENMVRWIMGDEAMRCLDADTGQEVQGRLDAGIYIAGGTGTGKSWCLEIMSVFAQIDQTKMDVAGKAVPLAWENVRADEITEGYAENGLLKGWKTRPVLGIQDLGSEPGESIFMGNRIQPVRQVLESRGDRGELVTMITSNIPMGHERLRSKYGDRVVSRLKQMCNYFELRGRDRRMK